MSESQTHWTAYTWPACPWGWMTAGQPAPYSDWMTAGQPAPYSDWMTADPGRVDSGWLVDLMSSDLAVGDLVVLTMD